MDTLICKKLLVELYELCLFLFYYFGGVHWNIVYIEYILTICKYSFTRRRKYLRKWAINMDIDNNDRRNHQSSYGINNIFMVLINNLYGVVRLRLMLGGW